MSYSRFGWLLPALLAQVACTSVGVSRAPVPDALPEPVSGTSTPATGLPIPPQAPSPRQPASPVLGTATPVLRAEPLPPRSRAPSGASSVTTETPAAPVASGPPAAILALRQEAEGSLSKGEFENAAVALERAIRIQPGNGELWHQLAEVRLRQQQPGLAEDLAVRSNLHAKGNPELIRANWSIIAEARRRKGDAEGAAAAMLKAGY